jgi:hypothetical protein
MLMDIATPAEAADGNTSNANPKAKLLMRVFVLMAFMLSVPLPIQHNPGI